jgi:hypothetical protein
LATPTPQVTRIARSKAKPREQLPRGLSKIDGKNEKTVGLLLAELVAHGVNEGLRATMEIAPIHERICLAARNHCVVDKSSTDRDHDTQDERQKGAHAYSPSIRNGRSTPEK